MKQERKREVKGGVRARKFLVKILYSAREKNKRER